MKVWKKGGAVLFAVILASALIFPYERPGERAEASGWADKKEEGPDVSAEAYCVIDGDTEEVIAGKNQDKSLAPASITKMLTALLVAESCEDPEDVITFSDTAVTALPLLSSTLSPVAKAGERMSVQDALYGMLLKSGNECANALAEYVSGSIEAFAERMNEKMAELGAVNTHFQTPSGLDGEEHYTTAYDMALVLKAAMDQPLIRQIMSAKEYTIPETNVAPARSVHNSHQFVNGQQEYSGAFAGKTGYTAKAGWNLATAVQKNGHTLLAVTLKSEEGCNYQDARIALDYAFGVLEGKKADVLPIVYQPRVTDMNAQGFTVTWHVGNNAVKADFPVWTNADGNVDMTREVCDAIKGEEISYRVKIADHQDIYGVYVVQAYVYDSQNRASISTLKVLMTGQPIQAGMQTYEGSQYYVKENGGLGLNWIETKDGCYYASDEQCSLAVGVNWLGDVGYYMEPDGKLYAGWKEMDGSTYYFQPSGDMATGFMKIDEGYYYFASDGKLQTGFLESRKLKEIQNEMEKIHGYNYGRCR